MRKNYLAAGASPRTPLGKLPSFRQIPSWWGWGLLSPSQELHPRGRPVWSQSLALRASHFAPPSPPDRLTPLYVYIGAHRIGNISLIQDASVGHI